MGKKEVVLVGEAVGSLQVEEALEPRRVGEAGQVMEEQALEMVTVAVEVGEGVRVAAGVQVVTEEIQAMEMATMALESEVAVVLVVEEAVTVSVVERQMVWEEDRVRVRVHPGTMTTLRVRRRPSPKVRLSALPVPPNHRRDAVYPRPPSQHTDTPIPGTVLTAMGLTSTSRVTTALTCTIPGPCVEQRECAW